MLKSAYILIFVFVSFLTAPTVVVLIDNHTDISFVFSMTEEEQTKNNISSEFLFNETKANQLSLEFLSQKSLIIDKEKHDAQSHYLEIVSPPPDIS